MGYIVRHVDRQKSHYGDDKVAWEIESDFPEDMVMGFCQREILLNKYVPTYEEWKELVGTGNKVNEDYFFHGYCQLIKCGNNAWRFERTIPSRSEAIRYGVRWMHENLL